MAKVGAVSLGNSDYVAEKRTEFIKMAEAMFLKEGYKPEVAAKCARENAPLDETPLFNIDGDYAVGTFGATKVKVKKDLGISAYSTPLHYVNENRDVKTYTIRLKDGKEFKFNELEAKLGSELTVDEVTDTWVEGVPQPRTDVTVKDINLMDANVQNERTEHVRFSTLHSFVQVQKDAKDEVSNVSLFVDNEGITRANGIHVE